MERGTSEENHSAVPLRMVVVLSVCFVAGGYVSPAIQLFIQVIQCGVTLSARAPVLCGAVVRCLVSSSSLYVGLLDAVFVVPLFSVFEAALPGRSYSVTQRGATWLVKVRGRDRRGVEKARHWHGGGGIVLHTER